jgi:hypothetical protein
MSCATHVNRLFGNLVAKMAEELAGFETDVLAALVPARASAGLADSTICNDTGHLELIREWFGRPLWEVQPADADAYFGEVLPGREAVDAHWAGSRADGVLPVPGMRHKIEIYNPTGRVAGCPLDEMNRPRASAGPQLRVPAGRGGDRAAVRGVARGAGYLPHVRRGRPQLRGRPAGSRCRPAGQRGLQAGPGRRAVGAGPVRQARCPSRQGLAAARPEAPG